MSGAYTKISKNYFQGVGGENIIVENNRAGTVINLQSDLDMLFAYRGNFHAFELDNNVVTVRDTSFADPDDDKLSSKGGTVKVRWQKIFQDPSSKEYYSRPCCCLVTVPALTGETIKSSGWLILMMKRTQTSANYTINDDYLGKIHLQFKYLIRNEIPQDNSTNSYVVIASLQVDENDGNLEIIQQQTGVPDMWLPLEKTTVEESSSSSSTEVDPPEESSSSSSAEVDPPEESSSSSSTEVDPPQEESSSSSDTSTYEEEFIVALWYEETTREYISANEAYSTKTIYSFSGTSMLLPTYPPGGYQVKVTGTKTVFYNDGTSKETELTSYITLFHDTTSGKWNYSFEYDNNWSTFMDYYDANNDIMYATPQYITYPYATNPHNPMGMLMVDHRITYNYSMAVPTQEFSSSLMLHVYA